LKNFVLVHNICLASRQQIIQANASPQQQVMFSAAFDKPVKRDGKAPAATGLCIFY